MRSIYSSKNGIYAFGSSLLIRPLSSTQAPLGVIEWTDAIRDKNNPAIWDTKSGFCFAEDLFGSQFVLTESGIFRLNPETGTAEVHSENLEGWATRVLDRFNVECGWSLGNEWQQVYRPLEPGERLLPRKPFVIGGGYDLANLVAVDEVDALRNYMKLARRLKPLSDGTQISIPDWLDS